MKNHLGVFTPCRSCTHFSATGGQAADLGPSVHWSLVELKDPMSSAAFPWTTGCSWCYSWGRSASSSSADKQPTCTDPIKHFELSKWPKWDHSKTTWMLCFERASNESRSHLRHLFQPGGLCRLHLLDPRWILDGVSISRQKVHCLSMKVSICENGSLVTRPAWIFVGLGEVR